MAGIILCIFVVLILIVFSLRNKNKTKNKSIPSRTNNSNYSKKQSEINSQEPTIQTLFPNINKREMPIDSQFSNDQGIIDVTGITYDIRKNFLTKSEKAIPYWKHQYVYSYTELKRASAEQQEFYEIYKSQFLKGIYLDVEGNSNYYFILLFDLLENEFPRHKNLALLEKHFDDLGYYYPKTSPYARSFLVRKLQAAGDSTGVNRVLGKQSNVSVYNPTGSYDFNQNYWGIGTRYKTKLDLSDDQVKLLNTLPFPDNNFMSIEFCRLEVIRFFLKYLKELDHSYNAAGTNTDNEFKALAHFVATKQYGYKEASVNYKYAIDSIVNEMHIKLFKHAENAVRAAFLHKRKLNTECYYSNPAVKSKYENTIASKFEEISPAITPSIQPPDKATEVELNAQSTTRWKVKLEQIENEFSNNPSIFFEETIKLGNLNRKNPAIENIFLEGSKIMSKKDREISLKLYIYYLYHDLKSTTFDNRQLAKTIQKSLFKTNEQLHEFEMIISNLIKDKNLEEALERIPNIYSVKRRTIKLDRTTIQAVQQQHSVTVELLNEYLSDEFEDDKNTITSKEINKEEVSIQIHVKNEPESPSIYNRSLILTDIQRAALDIFVKANFSVLQSDIESFAKGRNVFRNQLIESINESCYEILDDILIEVDEDYYLINQNYYQKILQ